MQEDIEPFKSRLRRECRGMRDALDADFRQASSRVICSHIEADAAFIQAGTVLTYLSMGSEVDLRPLMERHPGKCWGVPRILPQGGMLFHVYDPDRLVRHPFGMFEPHQDLSLIHPGEPQLALIPGLAFDRCGWRLGYGGGYYDRFLINFRGMTIGVTWQVLFLDRVPHTPNDIAMQSIVTEEGILRCAPPP